MSKSIALFILGVLAYFLFVRKVGAMQVDSAGLDMGNPLYFSLGKDMTGNAQTLSPQGLNTIASREGFAATPYEDPPGSGKFSIGYGHQISPTESFTQIDTATAMQLLLSDTAWAKDAVNSNVSAYLTQNQFDALVSFVYNIGKGAFTSGSVPEKLNNGDFSGALATMGLYVHSGGTVSYALETRRAAEVVQFNS